MGYKLQHASPSLDKIKNTRMSGEPQEKYRVLSRGLCIATMVYPGSRGVAWGKNNNVKRQKKRRWREGAREVNTPEKEWDNTSKSSLTRR